MPFPVRLHRFIPALVLTLAFSDTPAHSQTGAALFQTFIASPRSQALGEATVALRGYPGAAQINPATIGRPGTLQGTTTFELDPRARFRTQWLPAFEFVQGAWLASPSVDARRGKWAAAYTFKEWSLGSYVYRDAPGNPAGRIRYYDNAHKLSIARDLSPTVSVGAGISLIQSHLPVIDAGGNVEAEPTTPRTLALDLGAQMEHPFTLPGLTVKPSLGLSLLDFGGRLRYLEDQPADPVSTTMRGGAGLHLSTSSLLLGRPILEAGLYGQLSREMNRVRLDTSGGRVVARADNPFRALFTSWQPLRINTGSTDDPEVHRVGAWGQITRHAGVELSLVRIASVRLGRFHKPEFVGDLQYTTFGWGLDLFYVALDHSRVTTDHFAHRDMAYWTLTGRLPIGRSQDNFWPELFRKLRR